MRNAQVLCLQAVHDMVMQIEESKLTKCDQMEAIPSIVWNEQIGLTYV